MFGIKIMFPAIMMAAAAGYGLSGHEADMKNVIQKIGTAMHLQVGTSTQITTDSPLEADLRAIDAQLQALNKDSDAIDQKDVPVAQDDK